MARLDEEIDAYHLGFVIGPRLNAAGRLASADSALMLLMAEDMTVALGLAKSLEAANRERKQIEDEILADAVAEVDSYFDEKKHFGIVVGREGWHVGTIGIVASRLCSRYRRPVVVVGFEDGGNGRGSCRSIEPLDMVDTLRGASDLLVKFGGHKMAAGLEVEPGGFDTFRQRFNELCSARLQGQDLQPVHRVDAWVGLGEMDDRMYQALRQMQPLGLGNPSPMFAARSVRLAAPPRVVGKDHLKMTMASGGTQMDAIGFGMARAPVPEGELDVLFQLQQNTFNGRTTLQLNVKDMRATATPG